MGMHPAAESGAGRCLREETQRVCTCVCVCVGGGGRLTQAVWGIECFGMLLVCRGAQHHIHLTLLPTLAVLHDLPPVLL